MNSTIDSSEVMLVPMEMKFWRDVHSYASLPKVSKYQQWGPNTEEDTLAYIKQIIENSKKDQPSRYVYAVKKTNGNKVIGAAELFHIDLINKSAEIGYVVHPDYWGMGIGTIAASKLLDIGFLNFHLHRVHATCDARNIGSALKSGWRDSLLYSILDNEWKGMDINGENSTKGNGAIHQDT